MEDNVVFNGRLYERLRHRPENADSGHIAGVELTYQTFFTFLPSPLDGLGVNLNYTFADSSVTVFGRTGDLPFFRQSDRVGNAAVLYEKYGVTGQFSVSYNSPSLGTLGRRREHRQLRRHYPKKDAKSACRSIGICEASWNCAT